MLVYNILSGFATERAPFGAIFIKSLRLKRKGKTVLPCPSFSYNKTEVMAMDQAQAIFAYVVGGILLVTAIFFLAKPLKKLLKVAISSALACVGLIAFNFIGGLAGLYVGVNVVTALTVGILGVPGFISILILQFILR
jgi:inhibitor of the pro-sigma K processing machinery